MSLYSVIKATIDDLINTNGIQAITGEIHNGVMNDLVDAVGAAQVYVNPATTDNPGTPQNPRAYIALPGTYTNFGGVVVTAPIGVIKWDGTSWSVTNLTMPSGHNYFLAKTTSALVGGTPYTTVGISQSNGGYTAYAGTWVKLVDRRTGKYDFVQLTADLAPSDTSITFASRTLVWSMSVGSIVEVFPTIGMRRWVTIPVPGTGLSYVDMPTGWRPPPVECIQNIVYGEYFDVYKNSAPCFYAGTPVSALQWKLNASNRLRMEFGEVLEEGDIVIIKYLQPAVLETYTPPS